MRRHLGVLALLGLISGGTGAAAQESSWTGTTADLAQRCAMAERTFCYGFFSGAWQFYEGLVASERVEVEPFVCPGPEVTGEMAATAFLDWFEAHPEAADEVAVDGLFKAWMATYPCE
jgi:hypothetical protein